MFHANEVALKSYIKAIKRFIKNHLHSKKQDAEYVVTKNAN